MPENLVEVTGLEKHFPITRGIIFRRRIGAQVRDLHLLGTEAELQQLAPREVGRRDHHVGVAAR